MMYNTRIKIPLIVSLVLLVGLVIFTLILNSNLRAVEDSRDTRLDLYERTKLWVIEDMRDYLSIHTEDQYNQVKNNMKVTSDVRQDLFGHSFIQSNFEGYTSISFVDAQYTLEHDGSFIVYLLAHVGRGNETKELNFMVFVSNNRIYDIVAY